jgi:hypothetical protein
MSSMMRQEQVQALSGLSELLLRIAIAFLLMLGSVLVPRTIPSSALADTRNPPLVAFSHTLDPQPALISQLQDILAKFFDQPVSLVYLLQKFISEAAVAREPDGSQLLYNPAHAMFVRLPADWISRGGIQIATLSDFEKVLNERGSDNAILHAYGEGFRDFILLSKISSDPNSFATLEHVWRTAPISDQDKEQVRYSLIRPVEQEAGARNLSPACKKTMNQFVDDVRSDRVPSLSPVVGISSEVRPTRFVYSETEVLVVLSDPIIARYHVIAQFVVKAKECQLGWTKAVFAM